MGQTDNPTYIQGQAPESFVEAVSEMLTYTASSPVAIFRDRGTPDSAGTPAIDTDTAMNAFAQAGDFIAFPVDESAQALVSGDTTSAIALAFSASQGKVAYSFNNTTDALPEIGWRRSCQLRILAIALPSSHPMPRRCRAWWHPSSPTLSTRN